MLGRLLLSAVALGAATSPALAGEHRHGGQVGGSWQGGYYGGASGPIYYPPMIGAPYPTVIMAQPLPDAPPPRDSYRPNNYRPQPDPRWAEMNERCAKVYGDKGVGGALLGGVIGGVAGNRIAGKGDRVLGTAVGAVAGAVAGNVIDKAEDKGLRRECDDYFASIQPQAYPGTPSPGYYPGYAPYGYVMVPVMLPPQKPCVEKTVVTETWVETKRSRVIPPRPRIIKDKRVKEKRVYTG